MNTANNTTAPSFNVSIVPNKKTNSIVTKSANPEFGFIQLEETAQVWEMGWLRTQKKSTLVRADIDSLNKLVSDNPSLRIPGKIVVQEFPQNEVPAPIQRNFLRVKEGQNPQTIYDQYIKRAGDGGEILHKGGQPIMRFTWYDKTGTTEDIICEHDNVIARQAAPTVAQTAAIPATPEPVAATAMNNAGVAAAQFEAAGTAGAQAQVAPAQFSAQ